MEITKISKVLIANRGEIACRVMRTCKRLGIATVAVYSHVDADSVFVSMADEAICIGEAPASLSYLSIDRIIDAAKKVHADAIHPGYGFLSENDAFAERCEKEGIIFIGPTADTIRSMGSKKGAKDLLAQKDPSIPLIPGYNGEKQDLETLIKESLRIGFPVLLKASAGGGGKGMRVVRSEAQLKDGIDSAKREARNSFGDDTLLIEKYFDNVRHVEIQIVGDSYGNVVHCYERECSIQRRHQKVIEETPSVALTEELRKAMGQAGVRIGQIIKYRGAGTVEFIVDASTRKFYFLEVNTRLQVEHPITECVTGLDLVEVQIAIANGASLNDLLLTQETIPMRGHAIECRLYAEDPSNSFFPCSGPIVEWHPAPVEGVRYDGGIRSGSEISVFYDPLICKVISYGATRSEAIQKMLVALRETVLLGIQNNKHFLQQCLSHPSFVKGDLTTHFIDHHFPPEKLAAISHEGLSHIAAAATLWGWNKRNSQRTLLKHVPSGWRNSFYKYQSQEFVVGGDSVVVEYRYVPKHQERAKNGIREHHHFLLRVKSEGLAVQQETPVEAILFEGGEGAVDVAVYGVRRNYVVVSNPKRREELFIHNATLGSFVCTERPRLAKGEEGDAGVEGGYIAPMPGKILQLLVQEGAAVHKGDALLVMESMKMESKVCAHKEGIVKLFVKEGQLIDAQTLLLSIESN